MMDNRCRIDRADAVFHSRQFIGRHKIRLVEKDDVGKGDLLQRLMAISQPLDHMAGIDHRDDRIEPGSLSNFLIDEKGLGDGSGIGKARGFDEDTIEAALPLHQTAKDADQVAAHGAADAAVVHLKHFLVGVDDEVIVDADLAELIDDDGISLAVLLGQDAVQKRRLAGAEIAGQNGYGDLIHG